MPSQLQNRWPAQTARLSPWIAAIALSALLAASAAVARERGQTSRQSLGQQAPTELLSTERLVEDGGRVAWSTQGDRIAYDKANSDGIYNLYLREMATGIERCLTCEYRDLRRAHKLNPAWHPNGRYLVFQVQLHAKRLGLGDEQLASPERALWSDLWLARVDGKDYWQLTRSSEQGSAILDPHFSYEGERLLWSERVLARQGRWGAWRLRSARLGFRRGVPKLDQLTVPAKIDPRGLVIAQGFTPDQTGILITGQLDSDPAASTLEIYRLKIERSSKDSAKVERLTRSRGGWHEYARVSPRGDLIGFTSDAELRQEGTRKSTELWLMKLDGSDKRRLTRFNESSASGPCYVGDFEWNPEGDQIVAQLICGEGEPEQQLYLLHLSETLRRPTTTAPDGR